MVIEELLDFIQIICYQVLTTFENCETPFCIPILWFQLFTVGTVPKIRYRTEGSWKNVDNCYSDSCWSQNNFFSSYPLMPNVACDTHRTGTGYPTCLFPLGKPVLRIRIRIRIHMFLGLLDPDPLVRGMDPNPSVIKQIW